MKNKSSHSEKMSFGQSPKSNKGKYIESLSIGLRSTKINQSEIQEWVEEEFVVKQQDKE